MLVWLHLWSRSGLVRHHAVHQPTSSLPWGSRCDIYDAGSPNLLISTLRISSACRQLVTFSDFILDLVFEVLQNLLLLYAWALNEIDDQHTLPIPLAPFSCRSCQISLSLASVMGSEPLRSLDMYNTSREIYISVCTLHGDIIRMRCQESFECSQQHGHLQDLKRHRHCERCHEEWSWWD